MFLLESTTTLQRYPSCSTRRDKLAIICEILIEARTALIKTRIMYKCNLSYKQLELYMDLLLEKKLLTAKTDANGQKKFVTTSKGDRFVNKFQTLQALLQEKIVQPFKQV